MDIKGHAWKFGDSISTDHIAPGRLFHLRSNLPEFAKHVLEDVRPEFPSHVQQGDLIVGGKNFGLGSSREHAPQIIKMAGVGAVLAKSFARIFFRNAINVGLPVIVCDTDRMSDGDEIKVDLEAGTVLNLTNGDEQSFPALPGVMREILMNDGLAQYIKDHQDLPIH